MISDWHTQEERTSDTGTACPFFIQCPVLYGRSEKAQALERKFERKLQDPCFMHRISA